LTTLHEFYIFLLYHLTRPAYDTICIQDNNDKGERDRKNQKKKGFICDMDGVIYHGSRLLPGATEFVEWLYREGKKFLFLTNNSGKSTRELQQKLSKMGLDVDESHFYTSALATAKFLSNQSPGCSAYVIGEPGLMDALTDAGVVLSDHNPTMSWWGKWWATITRPSAAPLHMYYMAQGSSGRISMSRALRKMGSSRPAVRSYRPLRWQPDEMPILSASRTRS
jgi:hypothetical protein